MFCLVSRDVVKGSRDSESRRRKRIVRDLPFIPFCSRIFEGYLSIRDMEIKMYYKYTIYRAARILMEFAT